MLWCPDRAADVRGDPVCLSQCSNAGSPDHNDVRSHSGSNASSRMKRHNADPQVAFVAAGVHFELEARSGRGEVPGLSYRHAPAELDTMGCDEFVKGHLFGFDTGSCRRCAMTRTKFESLGEPQCAARPAREPEALPEQQNEELRRRHR